MKVLTYRDLERFRQCPYAFCHGSSDRRPIGPAECMDLAVRRAIAGMGSSRIMGHRVSRDEMYDAFWDEWDSLSEFLMDPQGEQHTFIKFGEKCISNFILTANSFAAMDIIASDLHGVQNLPRGQSLEVCIDEIAKRGRTAYVCKYLTGTGLRSKEDLEKDPEMAVNAVWALYNIPGVDRVVVQWRFLATAMTVEHIVDLSKVTSLLDTLSLDLADIGILRDPLPRETVQCEICPLRAECPRMIHGDRLSRGELSYDEDEGVRLVDEYADLDEKIKALKRRQAMLESQRDDVTRRLIEYSDSTGFMGVKGHTYKALVRHERRVDFPEDKTEIVARLKETGEYDRISMVNYPRLRSDVLKGSADPEIAKMARVTNVDKVFLKRMDGF
ncbi:MAG: hypothetical protein MJZ68_04665 [archaeon]|nr:hypothetical protein [archaeon]